MLYQRGLKIPSPEGFLESTQKPTPKGYAEGHSRDQTVVFVETMRKPMPKGYVSMLKGTRGTEP